MHDIDHGGNSTAVRLAALAALRKAQADGAFLEVDQAGEDAPGGRSGRGRGPRPPQGKAPAVAVEATVKLAPEGSAGVFAAVEVAVRKSRLEFVARLVDYRRTLDCDALRAAGGEISDSSLEEAQFIAHRISGVGKTLGFADLGDAARQAEASIAAYKLERSQDLRKLSISRIYALAGQIEQICAGNDDCVV